MEKQLDMFGVSGKSTGLPKSVLRYHPMLFNTNESEYFLHTFQTTVPWEQRTISMYGKEIRTPRLTAWFGDEHMHYTYSGNRFNPFPWTPDLLQIKQKAETIAKVSFNSVLLNFYRNGNDSVAWHSDNERELGPQPIIASVSFGEARRFDIRKKLDHEEKYSVVLEDGSLLLMQGDLQQNWEHRIAKSTKPMGPRINLTFRIIGEK